MAVQAILSGMMLVLASTVLPWWLVFPAAAVTLFVIAWHVHRVHASGLTPRRKRLRVVSGVLMMFTAAMLAYALGVVNMDVDPRANPDRATGVLLVWTTIIGMLAIIMGLAIVDALATTRGAVREHIVNRAAMRQAIEKDLEKRAIAGEVADSSSGVKSGG